MQDQFPLRKIGTMTLNENPENVFNEAEQIAFSPGNLVPGVMPSNDKLLQSRLIAYSDAQRHRIGPNFQALPIDAPKCPFHPMMFQNGAQNFMVRHGDVNYAPSVHAPTEEHRGNSHPLPSEALQGDRVQSDLSRSSLEVDLMQVTDRLNKLGDDEMARMVRRMAIKLSDKKIPDRELQFFYV